MDEYKEVFHPGIFLEELREWLADDKKHQKGLSEFGKKVPQARIFHDGIKAIFEEESADTEESRDLAAEKYKQSLARLTEHKQKKWKPVHSIVCFGSYAEICKEPGLDQTRPPL